MQDVGLGDLVAVKDFIRQIRAYDFAQSAQRVCGRVHALIEGHAHAQPEFGVVLEQGVRPGRSAAVGVLRPRGGRQVAAVDGRAAGGIGHHHAVAIELGDKLEVRRLAAAGAGAGVLK